MKKTRLKSLNPDINTPQSGVPNSLRCIRSTPCDSVIIAWRLNQKRWVFVLWHEPDKDMQMTMRYYKSGCNGMAICDVCDKVSIPDTNISYRLERRYASD